MNTTIAGHYSLGNVREVMKRAAKNCSLNYVDKMLRLNDFECQEYEDWICPKLNTAAKLVDWKRVSGRGLKNHSS